MLTGEINLVMFRLIFALACGTLVRPVFLYVLPEPTFEVLKPQGLRVSIPDTSGLRIFGFHANINQVLGDNEYGKIVGDVYLARNGRWTFEDLEVTIQNGDVLHYWIYAQVEGEAYKRNVQIWTYSSNQMDEQTDTVTCTMQMEVPTEGQLLFEDNFDSFNTSLWIRDIKMPLSPDYEFCVYHNENHEQLVQAVNGQLHIKPILLEDEYGENATAYGRLQLNGCTSTIALECSRRALSYSILPPVISARLSTKDSFVFRYGKIEIRAKFPQGDWLYPEMWLEPKYYAYGLSYFSGRIILGSTRSNENLVNATDVTKIFDTRRLDFGIRVGAPPNIQEIIASKINESGPRWTDDFHTYTTFWTGDGFTFLVDGQKIGQINHDPHGWLHDVDRKAAPFDQEFYITLGVGVGGVRMFPDGTISSGIPKPWRNIDAKAMLNFWQRRNLWLPSWRRDGGEKTAFIIDYVRVWSL